MRKVSLQHIVLLFLISFPIALSAEEQIIDSPKASLGRLALNPQEQEAKSLNEEGLSQVKDKKYLEAEETFQKALSLDRYNLAVVFNLASTYLINQKELAAITLLKEYVHQKPDDSGLRVRLGDAYFGVKDIQAAVQSYEEAFKLDPGYPELVNKLGTIYLLDNRLEEAEKFLEIAVSQSPKDLKLLTNLSSVYLANAKAQKSISTAKKALQIKPSKELYITLATAYEINKDYNNALIAFERARDLGDIRPDLERKIQALKEFVKG